MTNAQDYPMLPNPFLGSIFPIIYFGSIVFKYNYTTEFIIPVSILLFGWVYYLYVVYTAHEIVQVRYNNRYPVSPTKAILFHFIPLYNIYWVYKWCSDLCVYINRKEQTSIVNQNVIIGYVGGGMIISRYVPGIGLAITMIGIFVFITGLKKLIALPNPTPNS